MLREYHFTKQYFISNISLTIRSQLTLSRDFKIFYVATYTISTKL